MFSGFAGAALGAAGSVFANRSAKHAAERQQDFSAAEAARNRDWQERMSNTSYQRSMEDMRKAGLNPILAFNKGGASTPGGDSGQGAQAQVKNVMEGVTASAKEGLLMRAQLENVKADTLVKVAQSELNKSAAGASNSRSALDSATAANELLKTPERGIYSDIYSGLRPFVKKGIGTATSAVDAANPFRVFDGLANTVQRGLEWLKRKKGGMNGVNRNP